MRFSPPRGLLCPEKPTATLASTTICDRTEAEPRPVENGSAFLMGSRIACAFLMTLVSTSMVSGVPAAVLRARRQIGPEDLVDVLDPDQRLKPPPTCLARVSGARRPSNLGDTEHVKTIYGYGLPKPKTVAAPDDVHAYPATKACAQPRL